MTSGAAGKRIKSEDDRSRPSGDVSLRRLSMSRRGFRVLGLLFLLGVLLVIGTSIVTEEENGDDHFGHRAQGSAKGMPGMTPKTMIDSDIAMEASVNVGVADMPRAGSMQGFAAAHDVNRQMEQSLQELESKTYVTDRMLVKTGSLQLEVANVSETLTKVRSILQEHPEGFVESESHSNAGHLSWGRRGVHLTARVPSQHFEAIVASIRHAVGRDHVVFVQVYSNDVTDQYVDAAARADVLDASRKALQALLDRAQNVRDVLEVQRELNRIVEQSESYKRRVSSLRNQATLSTLSIDISERPDVASRRNGFVPSQMVQRAIADISRATNSLANSLVYYTVIFIPLAIVLSALRLVLGKTMSKWYRETFRSIPA